MNTCFASRAAAAAALAVELDHYRGRRPLVLAIPRGAVPMGRVLADTLGGDLDVVLVRKLGAPGNPEFAVGAVDDSGWTYVAEFASAAGADDAWLRAETAAQRALLERRRALYTPTRPSIDPRDRIAIVVDDGLATGATMIVALHAVRARAPARLVCAVPVASPDALERVRPYADELVCLYAPDWFSAVGQFYGDFRQVDDEEVVATLAHPPTAD